MKVKIVINTVEMASHGNNELTKRTAEVWSGEMDILPDNEYLTKISIIAEGINEPICEVPFSPFTGYYKWVQPVLDDKDLDRIQRKVIRRVDD